MRKKSQNSILTRRRRRGTTSPPLINIHPNPAPSAPRLATSDHQTASGHQTARHSKAVTSHRNRQRELWSTFKPVNCPARLQGPSKNTIGATLSPIHHMDPLTLLLGSKLCSWRPHMCHFPYDWDEKSLIFHIFKLSRQGLRGCGSYVLTTCTLVVRTTIPNYQPQSPIAE